MAIKKSELYSSLWQSCDELRGGMDASQYKDYVLVLLFMKYVSDKYAGRKDALLNVPSSGGFADMVALKGDKDIGEKISRVPAVFKPIRFMGFLGGFKHRYHPDNSGLDGPIIVVWTDRKFQMAGGKPCDQPLLKPAPYETRRSDGALIGNWTVPQPANAQAGSSVY